MDINRATIVGRLTRDPEVRTTPSGTNVTSFGMATNFVWTDQSGAKKESVEFHNIVIWRKLGEIAAQYLRKGRRVYIEGRLRTHSWTGQDGVKRNRTEIVADNMIMLDGRGGGDEGVPMGQRTPAATSTAPSPEPENVIQVEEAPPHLSSPRSGEAQQEGAAEEISVEDIPF